ncbi:MAG: response regulator [Deltaproteobacteria bacterium]|nr:response regulator [Deltaproteobacteria bacterium]
MAPSDAILIIDDNRDDIEITRIVLEEIGRKEKVEAATDGYQAMKRLRENEHLPSLILLDLKMPGMSGFDCLREIREDQRLKPIPVIVVTSSSLESDRQESIDAGADSFLYKTIDIDRFGRSLDAELQRFLK